MTRPLPEIEADIARLQAEREEALRPLDALSLKLRAVWWRAYGLSEPPPIDDIDKAPWRSVARAAAEHFAKTPAAEPPTECEPVGADAAGVATAREWTKEQREAARGVMSIAWQNLRAEGEGFQDWENRRAVAFESMLEALARVAPRFVRVRLPDRAGYDPNESDVSRVNLVKLGHDSCLDKVASALRAAGIEVEP